MWPFGWWRRFWRHIESLGDPRESIDLEELKAMACRHPATQYVSCYILRMARQNLTELLLVQSEPLPQVAYYTDPDLPSFESVVNRLKVMASLDPVIFHHPKEGKLEFNIGGSDAVIHVRFNDTTPDRSVHLRLEWLDEPPAPGRLA